MAVGCSHGNLISTAAEEAVLKFRKSYKPHFVAHLGDAVDTAAFRSGAKGTNDESVAVAPDVDSGLDFIRKLRPDVYLQGNHEDRLWKLANHHNAIVAGLAQEVIGEIRSLCKSLNCKIVPYEYDQGFRLGNYLLMHGWYYNEMAARDHAEAFGNVIFCHTHRIAMSKGRRADSPTGVNAGCLIDISTATYAKARRATLAWSNGFAFGEYCDDKLVVWLHEQPQGCSEWILPK